MMKELINYYRSFKKNVKVLFTIYVLVIINLIAISMTRSPSLAYLFFTSCKILINTSLIGLLYLFIRSLSQKVKLFKYMLNYDSIKHSTILFNLILLFIFMNFTIHFLELNYYSKIDFIEQLKFYLNHESISLVLMLMIIWFLTSLLQPKKIIPIILKITIVLVLSVYLQIEQIAYVSYIFVLAIVNEIRNTIQREDKC